MALTLTAATPNVTVELDGLSAGWLIAIDYKVGAGSWARWQTVTATGATWTGSHNPNAVNIPLVYRVIVYETAPPGNIVTYDDVQTYLASIGLGGATYDQVLAVTLLADYDTVAGDPSLLGSGDALIGEITLLAGQAVTVTPASLPWAAPATSIMVTGVSAGYGITLQRSDDGGTSWPWSATDTATSSEWGVQDNQIPADTTVLYRATISAPDGATTTVSTEARMHQPVIAISVRESSQPWETVETEVTVSGLAAGVDWQVVRTPDGRVVGEGRADAATVVFRDGGDLVPDELFTYTVTASKPPWAATAHASYTIGQPMGLTVTQTDLLGPPQVVATVGNTMPGDVVTFARSADEGKSWEFVRGGVGIPAGGGGSTYVRDWSVPLNVPVYYSATINRGSGHVIYHAQITVYSATAWLQDAVDPQTGVPVEWRPVLAEGAGMYMYPSYRQATWTQPVDSVMVLGARLPVTSVGTRSFEANIPVEIACNTVDANKLRALFAQAGVLLSRGAPGLHPTQFIVIPDVTEQLLGNYGNFTHIFSGTARSVREPSARFTIPYYTYDDVQTHLASIGLGGATYDQVAAATPQGVYADFAADPTRIGAGA